MRFSNSARKTTEFPGMAHKSAGAEWRDRLASATTLADVFTLCQGYVAEWGPQRLQALPTSCRPPGSLADCDDLAQYALRLSVARRMDFEASPDLQEVALFFEEAALRLAMLLTVHPAGRVPLFIGGL
jgi:hypothetical protein